MPEPRRRRPRGPARAVVLAAVVSSGALAVVACSSTLDGAKLESTIAAEATDLGLQPTAVACPPDRAAATGDRFTCTVVLADGDELVYEVEQIGDGEVRYQPEPGQLADGDALAATVQGEVRSALGDERIAVTCPRAVRTPEGRATLRCQARSGSEQLELEVVVADGALVSWQPVD